MKHANRKYVQRQTLSVHATQYVQRQTLSVHATQYVHRHTYVHATQYVQRQTLSVHATQYVHGNKVCTQKESETKKERVRKINKVRAKEREGDIQSQGEKERDALIEREKVF